MLSFFYIRSLFDLMIVLAALHEINWFVELAYYVVWMNRESTVADQDVI